MATGIAAIGVRDPHAMLAAGYTLAEAFPGRFLLGLGVSHARLMTGRGHDWRPPLAATRSYLEAMDAAAADGWCRAARPTRAPRVLAALGPRMLDLARERADGAHTYLVTPAHTAAARARLGPDRLVDAVVTWGDPTAIRRRIQAHQDAGADHVCIQVLGRAPGAGHRRPATPGPRGGQPAGYSSVIRRSPWWSTKSP